MKKFINTLKNSFFVIQLALRRNKVLVIGYFITTLVSVALMFLMYWGYKLLIDNLQIPTTNLTYMILPLITYLFFHYASFIIEGTLSGYYFGYILRSAFQNTLNVVFTGKLIGLDFASLERGSTRNLIAKVQDNYMWRLPEVLSRINFLIYNIAALIFSSIIGLSIAPNIFLVIVLLSLPTLFLKIKYGNAEWTLYSKQSNKINLIWYLRWLLSNFTTLSEIKIYHLEKHFINKLDSHQNQILHEYQRPILIYSLAQTVVSIISYAGVFYALYYFSSIYKSNTITLGDFTFYFSTIFTFLSQTGNLFINIANLYQNNLYVEDFKKFLNLPILTPDVENPYTFTKFVPRKIEFQNVTFTYPGKSTPSLDNVSFILKPKQNIAIIGKNGAGKTTIIKLLLRYYDPQKGKILIDGIDLKTIAKENWYKHIGILFQDFAKYNLTLKENIHYGDITKNATQSELDSALEAAQGLDLKTITTKGYKQILGRYFKGGVDVSIGQWQKIAIARALFRKSPILILDEPTSNIDAEAEYEIFNTLHTTYQDKSLIFISHRFSTVRAADTILVIQKGKIVEKGTHIQLMKKHGLYEKYFSLQKRGYE